VAESSIQKNILMEILELMKNLIFKRKKTLDSLHNDYRMQSTIMMVNLRLILQMSQRKENHNQNHIKYRDISAQIMMVFLPEFTEKLSLRTI
jgi:hypothetical protein